MNKRYYSYDDFRVDVKHLISLQKKFAPQAIVGVARGGLTLAHFLAEGLNIRDVQSLRTELYDYTQKREKITLFGRCEFKNITKVLVVDDIADSGETLAHVMHSLEKEFPKINFQSATLFYKPTSIYKPHFWVHEADAWIEFFWEKD